MTTEQPWNSWTKDEFLQQFGGLYEHSSWVAEQAWEQNPFSSLQGMLDSMNEVVQSSSREKQLELLRQHPDLGSRIQMSEHSQSEQAGAGLTNLSADQYERLSRENKKYTDTYGFPFILAVKGKTADQIVAALEARLGQPEDEEFATALQQVQIIVGLRLREWASRHGIAV
ncbi:2-oxo-4-hydroxy-4-carboxy-5-ureidoimidazoline decarboxylase [Paenibacillus wulumuqiensis]|uniref:2-oxo-4-hydroxy-4-carboxy-5-ureidoimidazoline decarboxylase n=1 Tax=Paenibacillus wulumuqiensis TaxID=1567107 RepID=UPI0006194F9C|nr:2-oxo-4-hydroxy-4-carboxy-5-ureidoimidazoline decarboxylase [Paenibacillus wulumuqiensis]